MPVIAHRPSPSAAALFSSEARRTSLLAQIGHWFSDRASPSQSLHWPVWTSAPQLGWASRPGSCRYHLSANWTFLWAATTSSQSSAPEWTHTARRWREGNFATVIPNSSGTVWEPVSASLPHIPYGSSHCRRHLACTAIGHGKNNPEDGFCVLLALNPKTSVMNVGDPLRDGQPQA